MEKHFEVGDKVVYIGKEHALYPQWYPEVGTIGTILSISPNKLNPEDTAPWVQWAAGSTSKDDVWCCSTSELEVVRQVV